jgi:hypothetical protein
LRRLIFFDILLFTRNASLHRNIAYDFVSLKTIISKDTGHFECFCEVINNKTQEVTLVQGLEA